MNHSYSRRKKPEKRNFSNPLTEVVKYLSDLKVAEEYYKKKLEKFPEETVSKILEPLLTEIRRVTVLLASNPNEVPHSNQCFYKQEPTSSKAFQTLKLEVEKNIKNHDEKLLKSIIKKPIPTSNVRELAKEKRENLHVKFVALNFFSMFAFLALGMAWLHVESIGKVASFMPEALAGSFSLILVGCALLPLAIIIGSYAYQIISDVMSKSDKKSEEAGPSPALNGKGPVGVSQSSSLDEQAVRDHPSGAVIEARESGTQPDPVSPSSSGKFS